MADPDLYRTKDEVEHWKERDPIALFDRQLRTAGMLTDEDLTALEAEIAAELEEAVEFAEAGALEPTEELTLDVYTGSSS
jgi:TPP-dependent pyruvate/acetoin dehydrogenase alpha subunit